MTTSTRIKDMPDRERPRERLVELGADGLRDAELIAILLRTGMKGVSAIDLGRELLKRYDSLTGLARCSVPELAGVKGVGMAKAVQLAAAFGLAQRIARESFARRKVDSPELVWELLGTEMRALHRESLRVVLLDTKYHLLRVEEVSLGSLSESIAHPREIFRPALISSAYAVIVVHNHPSGDPSPSRADQNLTRRLREAAELLQIQLLDHVILGNAAGGRQPWFSFRESGTL
jgi:DNA repair protein RadC